MSFYVLDSAARADWFTATAQQPQLEGLAAAWTSNVDVRYYTAADALLRTVTHGPMEIDTSTTPRSMTLGAYVSATGSGTGTAAYAVCAVPGGADILRADVTLAAAIGAGPRVNLDNVAGAAGLRVYASSGLPAVAPPAWLGAVGEWSSIGSSTLTASGAGWSGTAPGGTANYQAVVDAWGGGVINTTGVWRGGSFVSGVFLIIFGGGHTDYAGNEVMAFGPLDAGTPTWSRITDPTIPAPVNVARDSGNPVSRHTYDALVYLPTANKMLCIGQAGVYSAGTDKQASDLFDFDQDPGAGNPWSAVDTSFPLPGPAGYISMTSGYDSATAKAWGLMKGNSTKIVAFDAAAETWASWAINNPDASGNGKASLAPSLSILAYHTGSSGAVRAVDLRSTPAIYTPTTTGTGPTSSAPLLEWDEDGGRFVSWQGSGKTVYYLTPSGTPYSGGASWAWTSDTPAGGVTPTSGTTNGVYGRFRVISGAGGWRGILVMSDATNDINFFRMA